MNQKNIHWYPGHMQKAFQELETKLKVIDVVIEICDARAPISSRNPFLKEILKGKKKILVLSKKDFVEPSALLPYIKEYEKEGFVFPMNIFYKEDETAIDSGDGRRNSECRKIFSYQCIGRKRKCRKSK